MLEEQSHQQLIQDGSKLKGKIRKVFILQSTKCSNETIGYNEIYKISKNDECWDAYINKVEIKEEKEIKLRIKLIWKNALKPKRVEMESQRKQHT